MVMYLGVFRGRTWTGVCLGLVGVTGAGLGQRSSGLSEKNFSVEGTSMKRLAALLAIVLGLVVCGFATTSALAAVPDGRPSAGTSP